MGTIVTDVMGVFSAVATWFAEVIPTVLGIFYAEGSLTIIGTLAVLGLAVAITTLVFNYIKDFFRFR